jgi:hypothetical protein
MATACFIGFPALSSAPMFLPKAFFEVDLISGII